MTGENTATIAARAGAGAHPGTSLPLTPALHQTTVSAFASIADLERSLDGECDDVYYRFGHRNGRVLERSIADLEGADDAVVTASGMAALVGLMTGVLSPGDHVLADRNAYGGTRALLAVDAPRWGFDVTLVDACNPADIRGNTTPRTKLLLVEAVTNPAVRVPDLPLLAELAHGAGAQLVVDATFVGPTLLRAVAHGADLVWHSIPKYLGGHSAAMGGVVAGRSDHIDAIRGTVVRLGCTLGPFDAWSALLGLKTLPMRMTAHSRNAAQVARFLSGDARVSRVNHPALPDHPQHEVAARLYPDGTGGMLSFDLPGGRGAIDDFIAALGGVIPLSPSLGDVTTTLTPPAFTTHRSLSPEERADLGIADGTVRLSVGIDDADDIIDELDRALPDQR